jgi:hypothetical protein
MSFPNIYIYNVYLEQKITLQLTELRYNVHEK